VSELPEGRSMELTQELLKGAIDIHVHAGPHLKSSPRRVDPIEAAIESRLPYIMAMVQNTWTLVLTQPTIRHPKKVG
jgi:hypothetical protein